MAEITSDTDFYADAPVSASGGLETPFNVEHLGAPDAGLVAGSGSMSRQMLRVFLQNKLAVISAIYIIILVLLCIIVPFFHSSSYWTDAPNNFSSTCFNSTNAGNSGSAAPSLNHLLGCTNGIDNVALLFYSGRFSLLIGMLAGIVTIVVGTLYGIYFGTAGGRWTRS